MRIRLLLVLSIFTGICVVAPGSGAAPVILITPEDCGNVTPFAADTPNRTYRLTDDDVCLAGIAVTANNVTIDLGGHTLEGGNDATGASRSGVTFTPTASVGTVRNGTIERFERHGVFADGTTRITIVRVSAVQNGSVDPTGNGFQLNATTVNVTGSVAARNNSSGLSSLESVGPVTITSSTFARNGDYGIEIDGSTKPTVRSSVAVENGDTGIVINDDGAAVIFSRAVSNGNANGEDGIFIGGERARVIGAEASGNYTNGVHIAFGDARVVRTRAEGNGWPFVLAAAAGTGITVAGSVTGGGNVARGNATADCTPAALCTPGAAEVPLSKNPIELGDDDCAAALDQPNRIYALVEDASCGGDGFTITANNVTLDLGGHTLSNPNRTGQGVEIAATGVTKATVRNGTIRQFNDGVSTDAVNAIERITLTNLALVDHFQEGVNVFAPTTLTRSSAISNGGIGVSIHGDNSVVASTTTTGAEQGGGLVIFGDRARITGVRAFGNGQPVTGIGIFVNGDKPQIRASTASGNYTEGIYYDSATGVGGLIDRNTTNGNGWGTQDDIGTGIYAIDGFASGKNVARGNEAVEQCDPAKLC